MNKLKQSERDITYLLIDYLNAKGFIVWRHNVSSTDYQRKDGSTGRMLFGKKGDSDIMGFQKKTGRFICVEVKKPGYRVGDITMEQAKFISMVNYFGAIGIVASSVEELEEGLKEFG
jgi:hypothetical protein